MATLPIFGAGNYENILKAISQGTIFYPAWMYCRDLKKLGFVEQDGSFVLMKGDNKEQVVYLDKLPEVSKGDTEVLYIVDTICYKFDGTNFVPLGKDYTAELEALTERVSGLEERIEAIENAEHPSIDTSELKEKIEELNEKIVSLEAENGNIVELITNLETISQELTTKVVELEKDVEILENDAPTFVELE